VRTDFECHEIVAAGRYAREMDAEQHQVN